MNRPHLMKHSIDDTSLNACVTDFRTYRLTEYDQTRIKWNDMERNEGLCINCYSVLMPLVVDGDKMQKK